MDKRLMPCAYCVIEMELPPDAVAKNLEIVNDHGYYSVRCNGCKDRIGDDKSEARAIKAWNNWQVKLTGMYKKSLGEFDEYVRKMNEEEQK